MTYQIAFPMMALLVAGGCAKDATSSTSPGADGAAASVAASVRGHDGAGAERRGALHLAKECSVYTGLAGSYCTITRSNLREITVGSREFALKDADFVTNTLDSDGVIYARDGNLALNHCMIFDLTATSGRIGNCVFVGGIGQLRGFHANVVVSVDPKDPTVALFDGTYWFSDNGD
jgi:hypothetical protein